MIMMNKSTMLKQIRGGYVRNKGSKNLKTVLEEIKFEVMLANEKLRMCEEFELEFAKQVESLKFFLKNVENLVKEY